VVEAWEAYRRAAGIIDHSTRRAELARLVDIANNATTEEKGEEHTLPSVEEGRKRVLGIMASILAARALARTMAASGLLRR